MNPENYDMVYDGNLTTHRSIEKATVNLNGKYSVSVVNIYTGIHISVMRLDHKMDCVFNFPKCQVKISKTEDVHHSQNVSNLYHIKGIYIAFQYLCVCGGGDKARVQDN